MVVALSACQTGVHVSAPSRQRRFGQRVWVGVLTVVCGMMPREQRAGASSSKHKLSGGPCAR
jgi:hypothetical protein